MSAQSVKSIYPYTIVRYLAGLRSRREIQFIPGPDEPCEKHDSPLFSVIDPTPAEGPETINEARREAILTRLGQLCASSGFGICIIFGPQDSVYLDSDWARIQSDGPPDGNALVDPWRNIDLGRPGGLDFVLACTHELDLGLDVVNEILFYALNEGREQLWAEECDGAGKPQTSLAEEDSLLKLKQVAEISLEDGRPAGPVHLLRQLIFSRVGLSWPIGLVTEGMITRESYDSLIGRVTAELDANSQEAREHVPEIVRVAEILELNPTPRGTSPHHWVANCPGTNHQIMIGGDTETFGCGYCRRKGTVDDLRQFADERKGNWRKRN